MSKLAYRFLNCNSIICICWCGCLLVSCVSSHTAPQEAVLKGSMLQIRYSNGMGSPRGVIIVATSDDFQLPAECENSFLNSILESAGFLNGSDIIDSFGIDTTGKLTIIAVAIESIDNVLENTLTEKNIKVFKARSIPVFRSNDILIEIDDDATLNRLGDSNVRYIGLGSAGVNSADSFYYNSISMQRSISPTTWISIAIVICILSWLFIRTKRKNQGGIA